MTGNVDKELFIVMDVVLPDPCAFLWNSGKAPQMKSMFRRTFGWAGATKTGGRDRTAGHVMKWGY